jgi:hypothetical protein
MIGVERAEVVLVKTIGFCCEAEFREPQRPIGHDAQERSGGKAPHEPRFVIYTLLTAGIC